MKKLTTKLLMSIIAVAFAFVALGTSTYAWFTMSTQVSATGMEITAKSNATYLLIADSEASALSKKNGTADITTTVAAAYQDASTNANKKVYPAAYFTQAGTLGSTATQAGKWYTATNANSNNATNAITNVSEVTEGDADYMLTYKCWLTLSSDSEATSDWKIKVTFANTGDAAVSAVVVFDSYKFALNGTHTNETSSAAVALNPEAAVEVTVYVYIDGNSTNVYSDYINGTATLTATPITGVASLSFDLVKANQ